MSINLSSFSSVQSNLFVRIQIDQWRTSPSSGFTSQVLRFSDRISQFTFNGEIYQGLGNLVSIGSTTSELRSTENELSITISGIPNTELGQILYSKIKGSPLIIYRGFFDATTEQLITGYGTNPIGKFRGFINNFTIDEEFDNNARTASSSIVLECSAAINVLQNKISGRKTNPSSQKKFYSTDLSMDRVPAIESSYFDFGIKR